MTKDEALKMALETLEIWKGYMPHLWDKTDEQAITAIKEALAQPEQEPVVWMYQNKSTHEVRFQKHMRSFVDHGAWYEVPLYSEPLANQELNCVCGAVWQGDELVHLPRTPAKRKPWVGLTNEEANELWESTDSDWELMKRTEAKLREKNT